MRLLLAPEIDVRFGLGWGAVTVLDAAAGIQDGPGWWTARAAIQQTATRSDSPGWRWCAPPFGPTTAPAPTPTRSTRP
ncbi:hypothetical protein L837_3561 [Mycobacterium avium MAV_061107_1842]|nr:hypothetical protein L837_3561 [Mycobacterium avium MAV_061107_1842]